MKEEYWTDFGLVFSRWTIVKDPRESYCTAPTTC